MNILQEIKTSQKQWANNRNIPLQGGSAGFRGDKMYTMDINSNLFIPLSNDSLAELNSGDGNELKSTNNKPSKMQALHSSSALVVNIFEYWKQNKKYDEIAKQLGIKTSGIKNIKYENKFPIFNNSKTNANIDVCFEYMHDIVIGIESKFTEPFGFRSAKNHFENKYIDDKFIWHDLPNFFELANMINNNETVFDYLDALQLIKHILGLQNAKKEKGKYRLVYIFYSPFYTDQEKKHLIECMAFEKIAELDNVNFTFKNWTEIILNMEKNVNNEHEKYIKYIMERYTKGISNIA